MLLQIVLILEEMLPTSAIRSMLRYVFDTVLLQTNGGTGWSLFRVPPLYDM